MHRLADDHDVRMERVHLALDGLWVGDALGQKFFHPSNRVLLNARAVPNPPWPHTDDTEMAIAIIEVLQVHGCIDQHELAWRFARRHHWDPNRGYGATAHTILSQIYQGVPWEEAAGNAFGGEGSMGNGGAMRVAPVGAYFADDLDRVAKEACKSAEVTHAQLEGKVGAIAVALAAAWAWRHGSRAAQAKDMLETVLDLLPPSQTRNGIERALSLSSDVSPLAAASLLGNGSRVIAQDTVPFALWCARQHMASYGEAIWNTISVGGDIDTNCAIVGGIVALAVGLDGIPHDWMHARE